MQNDEVNLIDCIKAIKRRKVTLLLVILIGVAVSFSIPKPPEIPTTYQSIGHYKISRNLLPTQRKEQAKQFIAEVKVRYPDIEVSESSSIITIVITDSTPESARERQIAVAKNLKIKKFMPIRDIVIKPKSEPRVKKGIVIILSVFLGFFAVFIKEWWENNKEKL